MGQLQFIIDTFSKVNFPTERYEDILERNFGFNTIKGDTAIFCHRMEEVNSGILYCTVPVPEPLLTNEGTET